MNERSFVTYTWVGLTILLSLNASFAQQYPVQATTIITPPYSVFLADYVSPENDNLQLILYLREITRSEYKVKLRVRIDGPNLRLATKLSYLPPPIVISGGAANILSGFDIRGYFHPNNLDFNGISKTEFLRSGKLPEGFYTIAIEVLDYGRGSVVSNVSTASAWMILNDPPIVNLPFNNEKLVATDPQNIMFSWTPRHTASPNAAFNTEYEFRLVEINPPGRNPDDAVRSSNSIFSIRTSLTSLNYGMTEPLLIPGRKYAFRIRAMDVSGRDLFKNNGYSETYVFQYGDACVLPKDLTAEALDMSRIKITWKENPVHTGFRLKYREKGPTTWWEEPVNVDYLIIPDLKSNMDYEYQVKGVCGTIHGEFSPIGMVKTMEASEEPFQCQVEPLPFELVPTELSRPLKVNDRIKMTDLDIRITEITRSQNGVYSALGTAQIPMFNLAHVRIKLINIRVNDQMRVISGRYVTIYNPNSKFARTVDLTGKDDSGTGPSTSTADNIFSGVDISVSGDINVVSSDSTSSTIAVTLADQTLQNIARPLDTSTGEYQEVRLTDSNGDRWIVDRNGNVRQAPSLPVLPGVLTDRNQIDFTVNFVNNGNHTAGLDLHDESGLGEYDTAHLRGAVYYIPWKSVESGKTDYVNARASGKSVFPSSVGFKTESRLVATLPSSAPTDKTLSVEGLSEGSDLVKAYVLLKEQGQTDTTEVAVGKFNLVTYNRIENVIHIVPVNNATTPNLQALAAELNRIYGQAVAGWTVTLENNFTIHQSYITDIDRQESGNVASYNQKMRTFNRAFKDVHDVDRNHFYFFMMNGSNSTRKGFIPFKRGFGYIFVDKPGINVITTIAHELGHGAFNLKHTFSDFPAIQQETTQNLMDYAGGTQLKKYQWDYIHHPQAMIGWLQDDEESAMSWTLVDEKHTLLFNHIYDNHKLDNQYYVEKINSSGRETIDLEYDSTEAEGSWIRSWKISPLRADSIFGEELAAIVATPRGQKIPEVALRPKHIYLGNYSYEGRIYPVAIYGNGTDVVMRNAFTKVVVSDLDDLDDPENRRHMYVEETYTKYFIIAFYEEGRTEPSMIMQIEKFPFANSLETWLRYLGILVEESESAEGGTDGNEGIERAAIANRIDQSDKRFYGRFIEPERLIDDYVDCAEFVYDVLMEQGLKQFPSGGCGEQLQWYRLRENENLCTVGTDPKDVKIGDILTWAGTWENASQTAHTGIVVARSEGVIEIVNAGQQGCYCDYGWKDFKKLDQAGKEVQQYESMEDCYDNECTKPAVWKSTSYYNGSTLNSDHHIFTHWSRPKLPK